MHSWGDFMHESVRIPFINSHVHPKSVVDQNYVTFLKRMNFALHVGEYKACFHKKKYAGLSSAQRTIHRRGQTNKVVYPCPFCFEWHIGRNRDEVLDLYPFEITKNMVYNINIKQRYRPGLIKYINEENEVYRK